MSLPCRRVLVTGGAGFAGNEVAALLLARGYEVVVADDLSNPQSAVRYPYEFLEADVGDMEACRPAFDGADVCIVMASSRAAVGYASRNASRIIVDNVRTYMTTFQAAVEAGVRRLLFVSSSMVYEQCHDFPAKESDLEGLPAPQAEFAISKLVGERYCRAFQRDHGLAYTIIRPSNIYGPNERPGDAIGDTHVIPELTRKVLSGQYPLKILGDGTQSRRFVHTKDLARGIMMALESDAAKNQDFNLAGAEEIDVLALARMIWDLCEVRKPFETTSVPGFPGDLSRSAMDISKARDLLGWQPQVPFAEGLSEAVAWQQQHIRVAA